MAKITHEKLGLEYEMKDDLRQRDVEALFQARRELGSGGNLSGPEHNGVIVRAAARCGWVNGLAEDDVGDMLPAVFIPLLVHILVRTWGLVF